MIHKERPNQADGAFRLQKYLNHVRRAFVRVTFALTLNYFFLGRAKNRYLLLTFKFCVLVSATVAYSLSVLFWLAWYQALDWKSHLFLNMQMQPQVEVKYVNEDKMLAGVLPTLNNPPTHTPTQTHTIVCKNINVWSLDLLLKLFSEVSKDTALTSDDLIFHKRGYFLHCRSLYSY